MIPGAAALCEGTVSHLRTLPQAHQFRYPVSQVWIDPDRPQDLCDLHPAWSHRRPAPARFKRSDYGSQPTGPLGTAVREALNPVLGRTPLGPVRMLSQIRRWGWLFNPITIFFVWEEPENAGTSPQVPIGMVLEVTNTPWKERTQYPFALQMSGDTLVAQFDKTLHVSPFLGMDYEYRLSVQDRDDAIALGIDVVTAAGDTIVFTTLNLQRHDATRQLLGRSLRSNVFSTHRVSAGIHSQAARLWTKRVPFISHPNKAISPDETLPHPTEERP